jgi:hypothetical protein
MRPTCLGETGKLLHVVILGTSVAGHVSTRERQRINASPSWMVIGSMTDINTDSSSWGQVVPQNIILFLLYCRSICQYDWS